MLRYNMYISLILATEMDKKQEPQPSDPCFCLT